MMHVTSCYCKQVLTYCIILYYTYQPLCTPTYKLRFLAGLSVWLHPADSDSGEGCCICFERAFDEVQVVKLGKLEVVHPSCTATLPIGT